MSTRRAHEKAPSAGGLRGAGACLVLLCFAAPAAASHDGTGCTSFRPTRLDTRNVAGLVNSVAAIPGDYNRDGRTDVAVVNKYLDGFLVDGSVSVLQGDLSGFFSFASTQVARGGFWWATGGDFNRDAVPDIAAVNHNDALIFLGDGAGGFLPHTTIPLGFDPMHIGEADMNADGKPDLVVVFQYIGQPGGRVKVLLGDGAGGFTVMPPATIAQAPHGGVTGDFNGDGKLDVVAGSFLSNRIAFLPGLGNGTFGPTIFTDIGATTMFFAARDFDGDGKLDLIVSSENTNQSILVLKGAGNGTFVVTGTAVLPFNSPRNPVVCDFDRDGKVDVAVPNSSGGDVAVLMGDGAGGFGPPSYAGALGGPYAGALADVNADGLCDVITANGDSSVSVLVGGPRGTLGTPAVAAGARPLGAAAVDFDADGQLDLAVVSRDTGSVLLYRGDGEGLLTPLPSIPAGSFPASIAAGDFNGDGRTDMAVAEQGIPGDTVNDSVRVFLNSGGWIFWESDILMAGDLPLDLKAADFNSDGLADLVVANSRSDKITFYLANPGGGFGNAKNIKLGDPQRSLAVAEFTGDGILDVAVALHNTNKVLLLIGASSGTFQNGPVFDLGGTWTVDHLAAGNLDGDLLPDLVVGSRPPDPFSPGQMVVMLGTGTLAGFEPPLSPVPTGVLPEAVVLVDVDLSGTLDVVVANRFENSVAVYAGDGTGALIVEPARYGTGVGPINLAAGDFNGDSRADLAAVDFDGNDVAVLLNNTPIDDAFTSLEFIEPDRLVWDPVPGATIYNVYRDPLDELSFDSFGRCAAFGLPATQLVDITEPYPGQGLFYLVTAVVGGMEKPLGFTSSCLKRPNLHPCPAP